MASFVSLAGLQCSPRRLTANSPTLIPIGRVAADRPPHSGKHDKHGMNLQVIASPGGGNGSLCHLHMFCVALAHARVAVL
jgi:hypothetical protein